MQRKKNEATITADYLGFAICNLSYILIIYVNKLTFVHKKLSFNRNVELLRAIKQFFHIKSRKNKRINSRESVFFNLSLSQIHG
jgi:hypothetical protein